METCIGALVILGAALLIYVFSERMRYAQARAQRKAQNAERQRVEECAEVVHFFAAHLGYIARRVVSRDDLAELIDAGITADELADFIADRIAEVDALELGVHASIGARVPVKLSRHYRDRHVYIVGKSGAGKTTLLRSMIIQDMEAGEGLGVIAPEREMIVDELLPFVPEHRIEDVIYFNPGDLERPVSFNPLALEAGEDIDRRVDENVTIFKRLLGGDSTPRIDELMRQAFYALLEIPGTTLLDVPRLLDVENPHFRKDVITQLEDGHTAQFWREVYPSFPKNAHLPLVYRMSRFTRSKYIRSILCQPETTLNFRRVMDEGKILFCNLSDGVLGEQNSQLLGQLIVSKLQLAVMGRASVPAHRRRRFYLYVDEFQTFTGTSSTSYEKLLSRARKYRLSLILAHQQTSQIPPALLKEILGNVSTMVSFAVSRDDARRLSGEFISKLGGEVEALDAGDLLGLRVGETYSKIGTTSFPMYTELVSVEPDYERRDEVIQASRMHYGRPAKDAGPGERTDASEDEENYFGDIDPGEVFG